MGWENDRGLFWGLFFASMMRYRLVDVMPNGGAIITTIIHQHNRSVHGDITNYKQVTEDPVSSHFLYFDNNRPRKHTNIGLKGLHSVGLKMAVRRERSSCAPCVCVREQSKTLPPMCAMKPVGSAVYLEQFRSISSDFLPS